MKTSFKNILVPFDSSGSSVVALEAAEALAQHLKGSLTLVFVTEAGKEAPPAVLESMRQTMNKLREKGITCNFALREGKVYKEIAATAKDIDADLIIMGSHGLSGFQEFFAGSNAYRVATTAPCPVITMKEHIKNGSLRNIVLPIDWSKDTRQKVPVAAALAKLLNAVVHVVVVSHPDPEEVHKLTSYGVQSQQYLEEDGVETVFQVVQGRDTYKLVTDYAQKVAADLIMIMTEQESESLFMGPTAQQMIHHSPFPVMSVKPKEVTISYAQL